MKGPGDLVDDCSSLIGEVGKRCDLLSRKGKWTGYLGLLIMSLFMVVCSLSACYFREV